MLSFILLRLLVRYAPTVHTDLEREYMKIPELYAYFYSWTKLIMI